MTILIYLLLALMPQPNDTMGLSQWMSYRFSWGSEKPSALLLQSTLPNFMPCMEWGHLSGCRSRWDMDGDNDVDLRDFAIVTNTISERME